MSYFNSRNLSALSNDAIFNKAPAVFAEQEKSTLSDKYLFIPTIKLVEGMRSIGWDVVAAKQQMNRKTSVENMASNKHALFLARTDSISKGLKLNESLPMIKLENSHNGLSSFGLSTGFSA